MLYLLESEGFYMSEELKETIVEKENSENVKEEPAEDINSLLPAGEKIEKPEEGAEDYAVTVENARLEFQKKFKAGRRNSYIVMGVILAVAVASVILISLKGMVWRIVGWSLVGAAVLGMIIYYIVNRNTLPNATKEYIALVNKCFNTRNFSDTKFSDVSTDAHEKLELADPISDRIYKDLTNIASRNVINGHFAHRTFKVGDMGLYSGAGKNRRSLFVGKYVIYPNDLHFENRYILTIKGLSAVDLPDDIDDLKILSEQEGVVIYGPEGAKFESDLGKDFLKAVKALAVEKHLLNLNLVVWGGRSSAYLSYDDVIMTLPFDKEFNKESNEQYAANLLSVLNAFELLTKKEK